MFTIFFYCKNFVWISEGFMLLTQYIPGMYQNAGDTHTATTDIATERSMKNDPMSMFLT